MEIGKINNLKVGMKSDYGMYLLDEEGERVLLPNKYVPEDLKIYDYIDVFVYNDSEDRLVATTLKPKIELDSFGCLEVKQVTSFGAFMEWGLEKDLLVPFKEQNDKLEEGKKYIVYMYLDDSSQRLVASAKLNGFYENFDIDYSEGEEVQILVGHQTDIGFNVVVNNKHRGMVYKNELFQDIHIGDRLTAYVKKVRTDNKIDISLQKIGYDNVEPNAKKILHELEENGGFISLTDKSDPEDIKSMFQMSKKTFKKALGNLYKQKLVNLKDEGIYLND